MVEQGLARGMNLIDSFQAATGNRTLTKVHKKAAQEHRRIQREYTVRRDSIRFGAVGGAGAAVITGAAGALTLTPGWWVLTGIGAVTSFISFPQVEFNCTRTAGERTGGTGQGTSARSDRQRRCHALHQCPNPNPADAFWNSRNSPGCRN